MKKIYAAILFIALAFGANAQCTPDNNLTQPGYYPAELDTVQIGQPYEMVLQLRIPPDTTVSFLGQTVTADIDSIKLVSVMGLPTGFGYVCNVPTCVFTPTQTYCAKLSGTATALQQGVYPLRLPILAYAHATVFGTPTNFPPQPDTIDRFTMVVGQGSVGIIEVAKTKALKLYPNPAHNMLAIQVGEQPGNEVSYTISDITGKVYQQKTLTVNNQETLTGISIEELPTGIYIVQLNTVNGTFAERLIKE